MRMWMVDPRRLCNQHLLGEHVELHMLVGSIRKKKTLAGFVDGGLVELHNIRQRHRELVVEMKRRGFHHASPLPAFGTQRGGKIDRKQNLEELKRRCADCRRHSVKS